MVVAIREIITVSSDGILQIRAPELTAGTRTEVIVLLSISELTANHPKPTALSAWNALQTSMALDISAAKKWSQAAHLERKIFGTVE